jgi:F-type H+-transporting ATPase subunit epsilon
MSLHVEVVSPESILYEGEADQVVCRPTGGEIAFLPGHQPFVGALETYPVRVLLPGSGEVVIAVHGGFVEVRDDRVTVLSDVAELPDQIDVVRATTAKETAAAAVAADAEDVEAVAELRRAELRLQVAGAGSTAGAAHGA